MTMFLFLPRLVVEPSRILDCYPFEIIVSSFLYSVCGICVEREMKTSFFSGIDYVSSISLLMA
jgi:hypothetical protein